LETIHFRRNKHKVDLVTKTFEEKNNAEIKIYSLKQILDEKYKTKFVLYENLLLDVTKYAEDHPGGRNLINDNLYSDISRFMTGNQAYSCRIPAYDHNVQTCIYAINSLAYAKFIDDHRIVLQNNRSANLNHDMVFEFKTSVAESIFRFLFSNIAFKFPIFLPGLNWVGRHFAISSTELDKTRYYTLCLCLNTKIQQRANMLFENIRSLEEHNQIETLSIEDTELYSDNISFYIKIYNSERALSAYLHNIKPASSSQINIRGPSVKI